jgi:hypothetical protein
MDELTPEVMAAIRMLRTKGFAVTVFTSEELYGADPRRVSDRLAEMGHDVIADLASDLPEDYDD